MIFSMKSLVMSPDVDKLNVRTGRCYFPSKNNKNKEHRANKRYPWDPSTMLMPVMMERLCLSHQELSLTWSIFLSAEPPFHWEIMLWQLLSIMWLYGQVSQEVKPLICFWPAGDFACLEAKSSHGDCLCHPEPKLRVHKVWRLLPLSYLFPFQ